jgi:HicB family
VSEPNARGGGVKTFAIRLPDNLHAQFVLVAALMGLSLNDAGVVAITNLIDTKRAGGDLAAQATRALEELEAEATLRRQALQALLGPTDDPDGEPPSEGTAAKPRTRRTT